MPFVIMVFADVNLVMMQDMDHVGTILNLSTEINGVDANRMISILMFLVKLFSHP